MIRSDSLVALAAAFLVPLVLALILTPLTGRVARRLGVLDKPKPNKFHRRATPYLGGLAVALALVAGAFNSGGVYGQFTIVLASAITIALIGLVDDIGSVGPFMKLAVETCAAAALWFAGVRAGLFDVPALDFALTLLWVLAAVNALNLLDNMDGIAAGVAAIAALTIGLISYQAGHYVVTTFAIALAGASLGFLIHNFPPARIFMGDTGSLFIGFLLAALTLKAGLLGGRQPVPLAVPILALGVPAFDTALVIVARVAGRRPVYVGGTDHSSHRLAHLGLRPAAVAGILYTAQALSSVAAILLLNVSPVAAIATLAVCAAAGVAALLIMLRLSPATPLLRHG